MPSFDDLFAALLLELEHCSGRGLPLLISIELRFRIAEQYQQRLLEQIDREGFSSREAEIHFFKIVLPRFMAESAYYCLLNYAHNFCPTDPAEAVPFWLRQADRLDKFRLRHPEFATYYDSGGNISDEHYFTRPLPGDFPRLIAELWARERYRCYSLEKMQNP